MMNNEDIMVGVKTNMLTIISSAEVIPSGIIRVQKLKAWRCLCECGKEVTVTNKSLVSNVRVSCGCYRLVKNTRERTVLQKTRTSWSQMMQRCNNKKATHYPDYGGRGIAVCDKWLESFENFLEDMGERPDGTSLDRKD